MSSTASSSHAGPRRRWQVGIRSLLILVAIVAVGVWFWRRPFQKEEVFRAPVGVVIAPDPSQDAQRWRRQFTREFLEKAFLDEGSDDQVPNAKPAYYRREVRTLRRFSLTESHQHGMTTVFDRGGAKIIEETWSEGARHGPYKHWDASGRLRASGAFRDGEQHGPWVFFAEDGGKLAEIEYDSGKPEGTWVAYDKRGKRSELIFRKGVLAKRTLHVFGGLKIVETMDEKGELLLRIQFHTFDDNRPDAETLRQGFLAGVPHGEFVSRGEDGQLQCEGQFSDGRPTGTWKIQVGDDFKEMMFQEGRVVRFDGRSTDHFFVTSPNGPREARLAAALIEPTTTLFHETPSRKSLIT